MPVKARTLEQALALSSFTLDISTGCWVWNGSVNGKGYGYLHAEGRSFRAHRAFYEREHGELTSVDLHHLCGNRACVNPSHLQPLERRIHAAVHRALQEAPTECVNGHPMNEENSRVQTSSRDGSSYRVCRVCDRDRKRANYHAARAAE